MSENITLNVTDKELDVIIDGLGSVILENTGDENTLWVKNPELANLAMTLRNQFKLVRNGRKMFAAKS